MLKYGKLHQVVVHIIILGIQCLNTTDAILIVCEVGRWTAGSMDVEVDLQFGLGSGFVLLLRDVEVDNEGTKIGIKNVEINGDVLGIGKRGCDNFRLLNILLGLGLSVKIDIKVNGELVSAFLNFEVDVEIRSRGLGIRLGVQVFWVNDLEHYGFGIASASPKCNSEVQFI